MRDETKLPRELVWEGTHVSDVALGAIADGQEAIVDPGAVEHAHACDWCCGRLGRAALLSEAAGRAVAIAAPQRESTRAPARAPVPWRALAAALVAAMVAGLPMFARVGGLVATAQMFVRRGLPALTRGGLALASTDAVTSALPVATLAGSALLVLMGLMIARSRSRAASVAVERSMS
jgi:hypothetical protein